MSEASPRHAHAIYCDDVRQEVGNKLSLIGMYQGTLIVPKIPFVLAKLCILVDTRTSAAEPFSELKIEVLRNKEVLVAQSIKVDSTSQAAMTSTAPTTDDSEQAISALLVMQIAPFKIDEECLLRTLVNADGKLLKAGGLAIKQQQAPANPA